MCCAIFSNSLIISSNCKYLTKLVANSSEIIMCYNRFKRIKGIEVVIGRAGKQNFFFSIGNCWAG